MNIADHRRDGINWSPFDYTFAGLGHQITVVTRNPQKASSVLGPR